MMNGNVIAMHDGPKYPSVKVRMIGTNGGFYPTVAAVQAAMRQAGIPMQELSSFCEEAAEGDGDNLLQTCLRWVDVDV
jgi:hypothetical protein